MSTYKLNRMATSQIINRVKLGESMRDLADEFGVSEKTVRRIVKNPDKYLSESTPIQRNKHGRRNWDDGPHYVYRYWNLDPSTKGHRFITYVGITNDIKTRIYQHTRADDVPIGSNYIDYSEVETRADAEIIETYIIAIAHPEGNVCKSNLGKTNLFIKANLNWIEWNAEEKSGKERFGYQGLFVISPKNSDATNMIGYVCEWLENHMYDYPHNTIPFKTVRYALDIASLIDKTGKAYCYEEAVYWIRKSIRDISDFQSNATDYFNIDEI